MYSKDDVCWLYARTFLITFLRFGLDHSWNLAISIYNSMAWDFNLNESALDESSKNSRLYVLPHCARNYYYTFTWKIITSALRWAKNICNGIALCYFDTFRQSSCFVDLVLTIRCCMTRWQKQKQNSKLHWRYATTVGSFNFICDFLSYIYMCVS